MPSAIRRPHSLTLACILALAAILRLGWPGISEFKLDEATMARTALAFARQGQLPLRGLTSSLGLPHPPLTAYLLAIPFALTRNPALAVDFFGALGVLAVGLTYLLGARYFDRRTGLIAAALFATSPWAVFYSRKIWSQNQPTVTLGFMLALYALVVDRKPRALAWTLIGLGGLLGLHLGGVAFVGVLIGALALHPRALSAVRPRWALIGAAGLLLLIAPFAVYLLGQDATPSSALAVVGDEQSAGSLSLQPALYAAQIATGWRFHALAGDGWLEYRATLPPLWPLDVVEMGLIGLGTLYVVYRALGGQPDLRPRYAPLALWLVVPIAMWTLSHGEIYPHHFILLYPAQYLAAALLAVAALDWLAARWAGPARAVGYVAVACLIGLAAWQSAAYLAMLRFVETHAISGGHGEPVHHAWQAAQTARREAAGQPIVVLTDGADPRYDPGAAIFDALLGGQARPVDGRSMLILPDGGGWALETPGGGDAAGEWLAAHGARMQTVFDSAWGAYRLARLPAVEDCAAPWRLANGIELVRWSVDSPEPGGISRATLVWRVWGIPPSPDDYSYTVQLFTPDGLRRAQADARFLPTSAWREGDRIVTFAELQIGSDAPPHADYQILIAMYTYADLARVEVRDANGVPIGDAVLIPLDQAVR
jgi:4-amino-4-deoxy-L-arabinose transferase-like glycosyltransferase